MTDDNSNPDIVALIIKMAQQEGLGADAAREIELVIRAEYGGLRVRIPKKKKHPTPEQRQKIYQDGVSAMSTQEITARHGIDRSTLYRLLKKGIDE